MTACYSPQLLPLTLPRTVWTEASFVEGESNREAIAWLARWPNWPLNALVMYGPAGCGKTHLSHVWSHHASALWLEDSHLNSTDPSALFELATCFVLDRADERLCSPVHQTFLLHLYNLIKEKGTCSLLMLARIPPAFWPVHLEDFHSRLKIVPTIEIASPDDLLFQRVMRKRFLDHHIHVGDDLILFLSQRIERSFSAIDHAVTFLNQKALEAKKPLTLPFVRALSASLLDTYHVDEVHTSEA